MKKFLLPILLSSILLTACMDLPEDITLPSWDTELNLPIAHRYYTFNEMMKRSKKYVSVDSLNGFVYEAKYGNFGDKSDSEGFIEGKLDQGEQGIQIPVENGDGVIGIRYSNGMSLDSAVFIRGTMSITVINTESSEFTVVINLPAFVDIKGDRLSFQKTVQGNSSETVSKDLNGYYYYAYLQDFAPDSLQINASIVGSDFTGILVIDYSIENTMFSYMAGIIPPTTLDHITNSNSLPITDDVNDFRNKLNLFSAELTLLGFYFDNLKKNDPNSPFDIRLDTLLIKGIHKNSADEIFLILNANQSNNLAPIDMVNGKLEEVYTADNSNLSMFLAFVPDSIIVYAVPTLNPDNKRGAATNRDSIQFGFDLSIRSFVSFEDMTVKDTLEMEMDADIKESIRDFKEAIIYFKIDNKVAFGGDVVMQFTDDNFKTLFTLEKVSYEPAFVDVNGFSSQRLSEPSVTLDSAQIQHLAKSEHIIMNVTIHSTDADKGQKVAFTANDWIDIISFCKVKYHISFDEDEEENN